MFENFPYTDMHQLNLDWIIKIAKDFLDQYTHIQDVIASGLNDLDETITTGLNDLNEKAEVLEGLLQAWYDTHSEDIANQLADALQDLGTWYSSHVELFNTLYNTKVANFNTAAENKANEVIASIPSTYTDLSNNALQTLPGIYTDGNIVNTDFADMNTLPINRIAFYSGASPAHKPTSDPFVGYVWTINYQGNAENPDQNFSIQFAHTCGSGTGSEQNTVYFRAKYSSWGPWRTFPYIKNTVQTIDRINTPSNVPGTIYADFNTLPIDRIVFYGTGTYVDHRPTARPFVGYVITVHYEGYIENDENRQFSIQIAHTCGSGAGAENNTMYYRAKYAGWSKWIRINGVADGNDFAIKGLLNFTVLGDSISVSLSYPTAQQSKKVKSWAKIMSDDMHRTCDIYARGGLSTGQIIGSDLYNNAVANANNNQFAVIELGINDINQSVTDQVFTSNYQTIVDALLTSHKFVFCVGLCDALISNNESKNTIIKNICDNTANAYYLNTQEHNYLLDQVQHNGHFSATGYGVFATVVEYMINEVVSNSSAFISGNYDEAIP